MCVLLEATHIQSNFDAGIKSIHFRLLKIREVPASLLDVRHSFMAWLCISGDSLRKDLYKCKSNIFKLWISLKSFFRVHFHSPVVLPLLKAWNSLRHLHNVVKIIEPKY